ncbi:hypothetical protein BofuT4_P102440.1 [Botrytis cinerea T4]|uniref:Uncharacterized protein n=1 Tax=Botryotinia fuckeliana (strain T4) TaxID=999810 RepID=G2YBF2_BOTF4|nr:hypothetical protein BofuT4_P102440.1 [Botrytis cinerea T4]
MEIILQLEVKVMQSTQYRLVGSKPPPGTSTCHLNGCLFKTHLGAPPSASKTFWIKYE